VALLEGHAGCAGVGIDAAPLTPAFQKFNCAQDVLAVAIHDRAYRRVGGGGRRCALRLERSSLSMAHGIGTTNCHPHTSPPLRVACDASGQKISVTVVCGAAAGLVFSAGCVAWQLQASPSRLFFFFFCFFFWGGFVHRSFDAPDVADPFRSKLYSYACFTTADGFTACSAVLGCANWITPASQCPMARWCACIVLD